jgi:hypothetical protein
MLAFCAASSVSASASIAIGLDAKSDMNRDARRRWWLLTLGCGSDGCCGKRLEVVVGALWGVFDLDLADLGLGLVFGCGLEVAADLLLEACVCGFAKATAFDVRF